MIYIVGANSVCSYYKRFANNIANITICVKDRIQLLGEIVGVAPQGDPQMYKIKLLQEGKNIDKYINNYNKKIT